MYEYLQTKKRLIQNQSLAIQNRVENIGFDRRKLVFGEAGIPLKINIFFIPATVYPQVSNATFLIASRRSRQFLFVLYWTFMYKYLQTKKRLIPNQSLAIQNKVENIGFEPMTSCMPCKRSNQLS